MRTVPDRIGHHGHGLYRRMQAKIPALAGKTVNACVAPDVGAVSPVFAQFHIVNVCRRARFENEHKLVLRPVQGAHAAIVFGPDTDVL